MKVFTGKKRQRIRRAGKDQGGTLAKNALLAPGKAGFRPTEVHGWCEERTPKEGNAGLRQARLENSTRNGFHHGSTSNERRARRKTSRRGVGADDRRSSPRLLRSEPKPLCCRAHANQGGRLQEEMPGRQHLYHFPNTDTV
ncbi:hypothetical protein TcasGA2_TC011454 [Tribolium castaneum]|uniref:Uncharacterized protein n=1 Tax=Tribolium castaneum TaxID=7070 RepID=D6X4V3_TRICA|nr:hypothetical protein TcasGA2_TC011454 [Tribolium castaneum]